MIVFGDFDVSGLWLDDEAAKERYVGESPTADLIKSIEDALGYKLPASYIELMMVQNGGLLAKTTFPLPGRRIDIECIYGINRSRKASLGGIVQHRKAFTVTEAKTGREVAIEAKTYRTGSRFWIDEWDYPAIGVYFGECPSGGHDMICLDYRACGPTGEPRVVHVDQEGDFGVTPLAENFETFVRGLT